MLLNMSDKPIKSHYDSTIAWIPQLPLIAKYFVSVIYSYDLFNFNYDFIPYRRTTGSMSSCDSSGMTLDWPIRSIQMTLWTWTPQCWTPFGNLTCSLQMKREQTFTRSQQTTNCSGYSRMEMSSTASGDLFFKLWIWLNNAPGCTSIRHKSSSMVCQVANWIWTSSSSSMSCSPNVWVFGPTTCLFHSSSVQLSSCCPAPTVNEFMLNSNCRLKQNQVSNVALKPWWTVA